MPVSVVGIAVHLSPRLYVAATNPATSVVEPPPKAKKPARPFSVDLLPEPLDDGERLGRLTCRDGKGTPLDRGRMKLKHLLVRDDDARAGHGPRAFAQADA